MLLNFLQLHLNFLQLHLWIVIERNLFSIVIYLVSFPIEAFSWLDCCVSCLKSISRWLKFKHWRHWCYATKLHQFLKRFDFQDFFFVFIWSIPLSICRGLRIHINDWFRSFHSFCKRFAVFCTTLTLETFINLKNVCFAINFCCLRKKSLVLWDFRGNKS